MAANLSWRGVRSPGARRLTLRLSRRYQRQGSS